MGSISIAGVKPKVEVPRLQADVKPLTQEVLERYWQEAADELGLQETMQAATPRLGEHVGRFEVDAQTVWFADDFRPHKIDVLEALRRRTGMRMLDCHVNPMFVAEEEKAYSPDDKYAAMLQRNGQLAAMRRIFPEIDY